MIRSSQFYYKNLLSFKSKASLYFPSTALHYNSKNYFTCLKIVYKTKTNNILFIPNEKGCKVFEDKIPSSADSNSQNRKKLYSIFFSTKKKINEGFPSIFHTYHLYLPKYAKKYISIDLARKCVQQKRKISIYKNVIPFLNYRHMCATKQKIFFSSSSRDPFTS